MENTFERQCRHADTILSKKLKPWWNKLKNYAPEYVCDFWFYKNGEIVSMLQIDESYGFIFDPATIDEGVETIFKILQAVEVNETNKAKALYTRFADPITRINYLRRMIDHLEIYHAIGDEVIADLDEYAKTCTDAEFLENYKSIQSLIQKRAEAEKIEITKRKQFS